MNHITPWSCNTPTGVSTDGCTLVPECPGVTKHNYTPTPHPLGITKSGIYNICTVVDRTLLMVMMMVVVVLVAVVVVVVVMDRIQDLES